MTKFQCFRLNIGDAETYGIDRQFLWGDALLITPVLTQVINNFLEFWTALKFAVINHKVV